MFLPVPLMDFQIYDLCMTPIKAPDILSPRCRYWHGLILLSAASLIFNPSRAAAHASEQGLVLLLPTQLYIGAGVASVILTVLLVAFLTQHLALKLFSNKALFRIRIPNIALVTSLLSLAFLSCLIYMGFNGPRDPLANILPLFILTLWWVVFILVQAVIGDIWHYVNPWTGIYRLMRGSLEAPAPFQFSQGAGSVPGIIGFLVLGAYALADIAPDDPERLAVFISLYYLYTLAGMMLFGAQDWLARGECVTMLLRNYAQLSGFKRDNHTMYIGLPGWQLVRAPAPAISASVFILMILATGTFDGLNETFWWLGQIGINPLAFPGRSAVASSTLMGLIAANLALPLIFAATVILGLVLAGSTTGFATAFGRLAYAILPIALAYHFAHYLPTLLVNAQYSLKASSDLWATGADTLGLGVFYVTTGFFNNHDSVKIIWLSQAGAVVAGHIMAILISHAIALNMVKDTRKATLSQIPLAIFMVLYTTFGLWLLASPRGL